MTLKTPNRVRERSGADNLDRKYVWEKSFNYSAEKKSSQKNQRIFFAWISRLPLLSNTYSSIFLRTIKKGLKINLFLCSFHISAKIHLHQKISFERGNFIAEFFLLPFSVVRQLKHHKLSFNSRPSSTLFLLFSEWFFYKKIVHKAKLQEFHRHLVFEFWIAFANFWWVFDHPQLSSKLFHHPRNSPK